MGVRMPQKGKWHFSRHDVRACPIVRRRGIAETFARKLVFRILTQTGPSESVGHLDRGPRLEDHVTAERNWGRIDEAF